ncbi:MAG: mycofactocin system GMC family oxidoreductase MftG, partial [Mycobacterium sp.]|nr:mycofactocin system GMC family oxidoreductase MftG [Mycobacterium sp.]
VLIIGAGSAGSVVANRLSADPNCSVTVLEAGAGVGDPTVRAQIANGLQLPIGAASPLAHRYVTTLTEQWVRRAHIVRGAVVGGSGAVNGGYFCRGLPRDFDSIGLPGWSWSEALSHFQAIETDLDFRNGLHGDRGPIPVRRTHEISRSTAYFVEGALHAGYPWIADLNGEATVAGIPSGVGAVPLNIVDGVRTGPGAAFLQPALARRNLTLLAATRVVRVRISQGRAVGVDAVAAGGPMSLNADRIVLSAGAIESAHLLMLSGVGDASDLRRAGIPVQVSLPVGKRFADHPEWVLRTNWAVASNRPVLEVVLSTGDELEIRPYTGGFVAMVGDGTPGHPDWPHIGVALMQPRSRGRITAVSADPRVPPHIEHRYDCDPQDIASLQRGSELVRELVGSTTKIGPPAWSTSQHLCGTAPMGDDGDEYAVLDSRCRVRGIDRLWVIDGSVLPAITSRGPHASIVMLGHRAAEFVG